MNIVSNEEITRVIDLHEVRSAKAEPARHNFNDALADVITIGLQGGVPWQDIVDDLFLHGFTIGGGFDCDETSTIFKRQFDKFDKLESV